MTRGHWKSSRLAFLVALLIGLSATADNGPLDPDEAYRASQDAVGRSVGDYRFVNQDGQPVQIAQFRGRPLLISYIYTNCAFVCPTLTSQIARIAEVARDTLGADSFSVLTVGFDTRADTPEQMGDYAVERGITMPGWYFVSGDEATVSALARDIGFSWAPVAGAFDHLAQVTILDEDGRVYQQIYGPEFETPMIVDPLKRLALGMRTPERPVADFLNRVRLLCTSYDAKSGRYRFDYSLILEIAIGLTCALGIAIFVMRSWRQTRTMVRPRP